MIPLAPLLLAPLMLAEASPASTGGNAPLTIEVQNVRNDHGQVRVDVCPHARFLKNGCALHTSVPAVSGTTTITVPDVPPGEYAVQAFHDENGNGHLDRALFGIPREGVGFSRNAPIHMSPPKWAAAEFTHGSTPQTISFSLRYFMGPSGPEQWKKEHSGG